MKYPCNLIKDILPIYHDCVCSQESKMVVEEHLAECRDCSEYYRQMCESDMVEQLSYDNEMELKKAESYRAVQKNLKKKYYLRAIKIMVLSSVASIILALAMLWLVRKGHEMIFVKVNTDISQYDEYMADENANAGSGEPFKYKWDMDETIFPDKITDTMNVTDYKMVYYNPFDAQYLGYLVVDYNEADYKNEVARLKAYQSTEYLGYYSVTGFPKEYTLLAMYADKYQGFVYALTDNENTIIYVEIIFCNYFLDLNWKDYIPEKYLPLGFDASQNNPYRKKMLCD